ncbi:MAG TPA: DMT family transporter [Trebonia sp.]|nr:DMT family transporter [Trebonia sp.]
MDVDISLDYGLTLLAALLIGAGFVLQQIAAEREPDSRFLSLRLMTDLLRTPLWLAGIVAMVSGQILAAWSIGHLTLSVVEPLLTTNLIWALILAVPLGRRARAGRLRAPAADLGLVAAANGSGAHSAGPGTGPASPPGTVAKRQPAVRAWEVAGAVVLCVGVGLLSAEQSTKPIGLSFGSFSHWPAAAAIALIAFVCVQASRRRPGRARALLTGIAGGLVYGIQDALTRQTLEALQSVGISGMLQTWAPYALVGAGAIGIWLVQSAFSAGPLQLSLPAISAGEPVVGILLGIIVFGDRIQIAPLQLGMKAGGILALIVGVVLTARAPALSHLRTWPPAASLNLTSIPHPALPGFPPRAGTGPQPAVPDDTPAPEEKPQQAVPPADIQKFTRVEELKCRVLPPRTAMLS